ncbi:MAG TPA: L-seryl-tRNA(Sec) selenium transferase [Blastocatellia bacterium]|nr:L-seryl-tRNA(Sec) selenium transferase [Blastocatellia bacterium]
MPNELLRSLPSIDRLLRRPAVEAICSETSRERVSEMLRDITQEIRDQVSSGDWQLPALHNGTESAAIEIERRLVERVRRRSVPSLRRVINATGVIIHTNLGRAPLSTAAVAAVTEAAGRYSNLEYDVEKGERGRRESHCQELLARLTGAERATVVNNNAAAVLIVLNSLAEGGEVIVSRGELIEIGGSFRIPDVMEKSGVTLREVGTTNRTRLSDYERAINERTRLILRVHPSNYRIIGFTERPAVEEIAGLAQRHGIPSFEDLGSGCLVDLTQYGIADEPVVRTSLQAGISLVSFSGDKMLGGPQAGVIAGSRELVERVKVNPLMRALRVDKMTYAALEATMRAYENGVARNEIPVVRALAATREEIAGRAARLAHRIVSATDGELTPHLENGDSVVGGGSAPGASLPTVLVAIQHERMQSAAIEEGLRKNSIPIIARIERDRVLIDLRTVMPDEEDALVQAMRDLAGAARRSSVYSSMPE